MRILLISDIHHGKDVNYENLKGLDYINVFGSRFKDICKKLKTYIDNSDLVINLGDLIQDKDMDSDKNLYKESLDLLNNKDIHHVLGNHDLRNLDNKEFNKILKREKEFYSFDLGDFHHIILSPVRDETLKKTDDYHPGKEQFYITDEQKDWLIKDLENTNLSSFIYIHYPLDEQIFDQNYYFVNLPQSGRLINREDIRKVLEKSNKVKCVFNGHTHFPNKEIINNISYYTIPSFSENDGTGKPKKEFGIYDTSNQKLSIIKI